MLQSLVTEFCDDFLAARGATEIWVACSGGLDSTALLDLTRDYARRRRVPVGVVHFNHNLRPGAREDELLVARQAFRNRLVLVLGQGRDLAARARAQKHVSLESAARDARYAFFHRLLKSRKKALLLTAHQADDQSETILMNLMRGAGLRGLKGIPARRGRIGRPLLGATRAELEDFVKARGLVYREDESNRSPEFFRNRVRHELMPVVRRLGGVGVEKRIAAAGGRLAADLALIDGQLKPCRDAIESRPGGQVIRRSLLAAMPEALRPHLLATMMHRAGGEKEVSARVLKDLSRLVGGRRESRYDLGSGLLFRAGPETVFIGRPESVEGSEEGPGYELEIPACGTFVLPCDLGWLKIVPGESERSLAVCAGTFAADPREELVDGDRLIFPLGVRNRRPGDRFSPLGVEGEHRKLKKFFQEQGISPPLRASWPLLVNGDGKIVWVIGLRLGHAFRLRPQTRFAVRLEFVPGPGFGGLVNRELRVVE